MSKHYWSKHYSDTRTTLWASWSSAGLNWREKVWVNYFLFDWLVGVSIGRAWASIPGVGKMLFRLSLTFAVGPVRFGGRVYAENAPAKEVGLVE